MPHSNLYNFKSYLLELKKKVGITPHFWSPGNARAAANTTELGRPLRSTCNKLEMQKFRSDLFSFYRME